MNLFKINTVPRSVWRNPKHFIAFGFGVGAAPIAPGTFGTLLGIPLVLLLANLPWAMYLAITVILIAVAMWLCEVCSKDIGIHDHSGMCIDEVVTFPLVMLAVPITWYWLLLGFLLFRLFDIWKPYPISYLDKNVGGGFGMVIDDVLAAIYAGFVLQLILLLV